MTKQTESPAFKALEEALIQKRKAMYGDKWDQVDWYGNPIDSEFIRRIEQAPRRTLKQKLESIGFGEAE